MRSAIPESYGRVADRLPLPQKLPKVEIMHLMKCAHYTYPLLNDLQVQSTQLDAVEPIILLREAYDLLKWTPPAKPKFVIVANYDEAALGTRIYNFLDADVVEMPDVVLNWRAVHDDYPDLGERERYGRI